MTVTDLPAVNASLNALSTVFILLGLGFIKAERKLAHIVCMCGALVTSTLFGLAVTPAVFWLIGRRASEQAIRLDAPACQ